MLHSPRKPRSGQNKNCYLTHTPFVGYVLQRLFYKIFFKVHSLARRGSQASGGQPQAGFFQTYTKTIPGSGSSTVPNFIEICPMVWISIADIQTHTCIDFYVLDENEMN